VNELKAQLTAGSECQSSSRRGVKVEAGINTERCPIVEKAGAGPFGLGQNLVSLLQRPITESWRWCLKWKENCRYRKS
jgi:hypothetical protein